MRILATLEYVKRLGNSSKEKQIWKGGGRLLYNKANRWHHSHESLPSRLLKSKDCLFYELPCCLPPDPLLFLCWCICLFFLFRSRNSAAPVTTQPSPGGAALSSIIPVVVHPGGKWSTGLFDVCSDKRVCVCGLLCGPCLECSTASRYGECFCFPLLLGSTLGLRVGTRERYKIHRTLCEDWMAVHCCWPFAVCQAAREMERRSIFQIYEINSSSPPPPSVKDALV
ncbi:PLAC8-like protein 1 [Heteronotia binoei]|uniref:PLAC8-like protein 1 n=1 Tax=Heteronotia binoei TaxID=13085 RepID=UPI00292CE1AA|nr:PLAC8-like protein 1 [Heteronotia binoei]